MFILPIFLNIHKFRYRFIFTNNIKAVGSHIVFKEKLDEHGNYVKFKAHIVIKGFL